MTGTLIVIILICGFIALVQAVNSLSENPRTFLAVAIILAFMYLLLVGSVWFVYMAFGMNELVVYGALAFVALLMFVMALKFMLRHQRSMDNTHTILFIIYCVVVLYLTLFSREFGSDKSVQVTAFAGVREAIAEKSWEPMYHSYLNLLLFVPFGYLIPMMNRKHLARWGFAVIGGVTVSTIIEGLQMIAEMGQCDIDDIIFNSIGAAVGYLFFVFMRRVRKNWRVF